MNNEQEFKQFLKDWEAGQPRIKNVSGGYKLEVDVSLDTKPINKTNIVIDPAIQLKYLDSLPHKMTVQKLQYIFHYIPLKAAKILAPHLLRIKDNLLGNPNATIGIKRNILGQSNRTRKVTVWCDEVDVYLDILRSLTFTFVQQEQNSNLIIQHKLLMIDVKINF